MIIRKTRWAGDSVERLLPAHSKVACGNVCAGNVIDPLDVIEGATLQQLLTTLENSLLHPREVAKYGKTKRKDFPQGTCIRKYVRRDAD